EMVKSTRQMQIWEGEFGKDYTDRNALLVDQMQTSYKRDFGHTRTEMNAVFLGALDRSIRILEVGSNIGLQLACLQGMGFRSLYGIELQPYAVERSKTVSKNINLIQGSAFDIPYKDCYFDLVFTSGVLIHIAPTDIATVLNEIFRCSNRYI